MDESRDYIMIEIGRIRKEYEAAASKKRELSEKLRQIEKTEPNNFYEARIIRDQIAYWEGRSEGLLFALDALERRGKHAMKTEAVKDVSGQYCPRFGEIAFERGFITSEQLKKALSAQVEDEIADRPRRLIGTILFEKGWMTHEQIQEVLNQLFK